MAIYPFSPADMRYPIKAYIDNVSPAGPVGAFGLPLVAEEYPIPRLQVSFPYNLNPTQVTTATANGGTVTQANGKAVLQTQVANNASASIRTRFAARYTPGQGQAVKFTAVFTQGVAGSQQEIGIGDTVDGFFFAYVGATFGIIRRRGGVDDFIPQSSWNGTFNGASSVPAGFNPVGAGNVYVIRYQWLGFGAIYFFIEDPTTGYQFLVHTIQYAGTSALTSILNPTLPLSARVLNSGNTTNLTLQTPSIGVYSEGPFNDQGAPFAFGNRKTGVTTALSILGIRNKTQVFGGPAGNNRVNVHLNLVSLAISGNADSMIRILLNPTVTGQVFADLDTNSSVMEVDTAGGAITAVGREVLRFPSTGNFQESQDVSEMQIRLAPGDSLVAEGTSFGAAIAPNVGLTWHEEL